MSPHPRPASLLERAAEIYDFESRLRARQGVAPEPAPLPSEPAPIPAEPAPIPAEPRSFVPRDSAPRVTVDLAGLAESGFILPDDPVSELAEEFRLIKRQLLASIASRAGLAEEKRRSVLVSSAQANEGKTFCAVNLALSLAGERNLEVLLVDGDFLQPSVLPSLGIEGKEGLVDALADPDADPEAFVLRTDVRGLSVLPSGRKVKNVPELLASQRTPQVLARLVGADPRRILIFDSPPALAASAATIFAAHVGQVLLVVRADRTVEADLRQAVALFSACEQVGLILNSAAFAGTGRKFGSYYDGYGP